MASFSILVTFLVRLVLVLLFLPFSALDKVVNFRGAVGQASETFRSSRVAMALIGVGFLVEVFTSLGVLTGIADRAAAFVLAGYCGATALLWKRFWAPGDFWKVGESRARGLFWDFLKNFALGAGLLLITFGTGASSVGGFLSAPMSSSHPYRLDGAAR